MTTIKATRTTHYNVDTDSIKDVLNNPNLTDVQLVYIAEVLVANLEDPSDEVTTVDLSKESMFNDSYHDMLHDLIDDYS